MNPFYFFKTRKEKPEESKTDVGDKPSTKTVSSDLGSQIDEGSKTDSGDEPSTKTASCDLESQIDEGMSLFIMSKYVDNTGYFSSPLKKQVLISNDGKIPNTMSDCIDQLQKRGIEMVGILRTNGNHLKIQETRKLLETGKEVNFNEIDIETVASIFKLWLRELPTPLIPFTCYSKLLALGATVKKLRKEEKLAWMDKVKSIIVTIDSPEKECLRFLMEFLHKVAKKSEVNKMDPKI